MEVSCGILAQVAQTLLLFVGGDVFPVLRDFHADSLCQKADGIGIFQTFHFHDEVDHAAALVTAKAVVDTLVGRYGEGGGLFIVEGTKPKEVAATASQSHIQAHHILDRIAGCQFIDK